MNNKEYFLSLLEEIKRDTGASSSMQPAIEHPAMAKIIGMGLPACQLIVDYWAESPNDGPHLFYALREITQTSPTFPKQFYGKIKMLEGAWVSLLLEKGLIKEKEIDFQRNGTWKLRD